MCLCRHAGVYGARDVLGAVRREHRRVRVRHVSAGDGNGRVSVPGVHEAVRDLQASDAGHQAGELQPRGQRRAQGAHLPLHTLEDLAAADREGARQPLVVPRQQRPQVRHLQGRHGQAHRARERVAHPLPAQGRRQVEAQGRVARQRGDRVPVRRGPRRPGADRARAQREHRQDRRRRPTLSHTVHQGEDTRLQVRARGPARGAKVKHQRLHVLLLVDFC